MSKAIKKSASSKRVELVKNEGGTDSLFKKKAQVDRGDYVVKSRPTTIKPGAFTEDDVLEGILLGVHRIEADRKDKTSKAWCKIHLKAGEQEVEMAATAIIRAALEITMGEGEGEVECPYIGHAITIELGTPTKVPSKKGNDAWNFKVGISAGKV